MKRLYASDWASGVRAWLGGSPRPVARSLQRTAGYAAMRLDTLVTMASAHTLIGSLGFQPIAPYRHSPVPGTSFLEQGFQEGERLGRHDHGG